MSKGRSTMEDDEKMTTRCAAAGCQIRHLSGDSGDLSRSGASISLLRATLDFLWSSFCSLGLSSLSFCLSLCSPVSSSSSSVLYLASSFHFLSGRGELSGPLLRRRRPWSESCLRRRRPTTTTPTTPPTPPPTALTATPTTTRMPPSRRRLRWRRP